MKKTLALLMSLLILGTTVVGLASCADESEEPQVTTQGTTVQPGTTETSGGEDDPILGVRDKSDLPDERDLDGFVLKVSAMNTTLDTLSVFGPEEDSSDSLEATMFARNSKLFNQYNFSIETYGADDGDAQRDELTKDYMTQDGVYDIAVAWAGSSICKLIPNGLFMDLNEVPNIDLSKNYWDQQLTEELSILGKTYFAGGDIIVQDNEQMMAILANLSLAKDAQLPDRYETVEDGEWTLDVMISDMKLVSNDIDGDGGLEKGETIGLVYSQNNLLAWNFAGAGMSLYENEDGVPKLLDDKNTLLKFSDVCEKLEQLYATDIAYDWFRFPNPTPDLVNGLATNTILYMDFGLGSLRRTFRDIETELGVLPLPKYDEQQEEYYTTVWKDFEPIAVLSAGKEHEKTGFVLEALASNSYELNYAYYELCLQSKYTRDERSYEILMDLHDHILYDVGFIYGFGNIYQALNDNFSRTLSAASLVTEYSANQEAAKITIEDYLEMVRELPS